MDSRVARQIGSTCFALHVRRAARQVSRNYDEALKPVGLTNGQFSLMTILAAMGECALGDLAQHLGVDRSTLNANLKPLERDGLIVSESDLEDQRIRRLSLSEQGRRRIADAKPLWDAAQAKVETKLAGGSGEALRSYLREIS